MFQAERSAEAQTKSQEFMFGSVGCLGLVKENGARLGKTFNNLKGWRLFSR